MLANYRCCGTAVHLRNRRCAGAVGCTYRATDEPILESDPNVDAAVLRAGAVAIVRRREKPVVATGRRPRMIVAVLCSGVAAIVIVMIVTPHLIAAIVMLRLLVLMVLGALVLVLLLAVLRADGQRHECAERERRHGKD